MKISIGKSKKDELFLGTFVHFAKSRRFYHTLTSLSIVFSKLDEIVSTTSLPQWEQPAKDERKSAGLRDTVRPELRFSAKVQKRSAKVKCKSEIARSAKTSESIIILFIVYHTSRRVSREIIRNLHKLAFIGVNSSEARWFRVPPPELVCVFLQIK